MKRSLDDNAVAAECIESICDDLSAIKKNPPMLPESHLLAAAYDSAHVLGWGQNEGELRWIFQRVVNCLRWPLPRGIAQ